jgi:hypothetical protein
MQAENTELRKTLTLVTSKKNAALITYLSSENIERATIDKFGE